MKIMKVGQPMFVQPIGNDGSSCPAGSFESSARLDVQAAMIRNHTWISAAWRTWDNQHAAAPEPYPVVTVEIGEERG